MPKSKKASIAAIVLFLTVIFIPIGIVIMLYYTDWKKLSKIIISTSLMLFYILLFFLIFNLKPSYNTSGISLPFSYSQGATAFETESFSQREKVSQKEGSESDSRKKGETIEEESESDKKMLKKNKGRNFGDAIFPILFFLALFILIIYQNLRSKKEKTKENPYVDTNLYNLPLEDDAKMPVVHYLKLRLNPQEIIYYATETNQKDNEGDFVITNQRVRISNKEECIDFPLNVLEAVTSISDSCIMLISGTRKYYIFMDQSQVRYALAVLRWSVKKIY